VAEFSPSLGVLSDVSDPRRAEGKLHQLPYVLLFASRDESRSVSVFDPRPAGRTSSMRESQGSALPLGRPYP
jgi:hypothetical protein